MLNLNLNERISLFHGVLGLQRGCHLVALLRCFISARIGAPYIWNRDDYESSQFFPQLHESQANLYVCTDPPLYSGRQVSRGVNA